MKPNKKSDKKMKEPKPYTDKIDLSPEKKEQKKGKGC